MASSLSSLFSNNLSPFSTEEDKEEETEDEDKKEDTDETKEEKDDSSEGEEPPTEDEDNDAENEEKKEELEEPEPEDEQEIESSDPPAEDENEIGDDEAVPEYLLKLSSPPNLNNALYRLELDRVLGLVLTNPPKSMSNDTIKLLTNLRAHWLHLISLPILKLIINKINKTGVNHD